MTGDDIKRLRVGKNWSQKQLGNFLGIKQATVSRLENGQWEASGPVRRLLESLSSDAPVQPDSAGEAA